MDCSKCISKCKAACCGPVPFDRDFVEKNPPKKEVETMPVGDKIILITDDLACPYLDENYLCSIYDDRPEVCRKFGDETALLLMCPYQNKDGVLRKRPERRRLERQIKKLQEAKL